MHKVKGLRRRWLLNTVGVICILGLLCVLAVTVAFGLYHYSSTEKDLRMRAQSTLEYFAEHSHWEYEEYYQSCVSYAQTFDSRSAVTLLFID